MAPASLRPVTREQLAYLRAHIQEAIAEDRVVCLECGSQFRNLGRHLVLTHKVSVEDYRETWGYNRLTPLVCGEVLELFRANANARCLGTKNTREMALEALRARQAKGCITLRRQALERLREVRRQDRAPVPHPRSPMTSSSPSSPRDSP